jgi:Tol biopolymer transport system component
LVETAPGGPKTGRLRILGLLLVAGSCLWLALLLLRPGSGAKAGQPGVALFDRGGKELERLRSGGDYLVPRFSPDGRRLAMDMVDEKTHHRDIWVCDLDKKSWSRLTTDPSSATHPVWSPDGRRILFTSTRRGRSVLYARAADGSGGEELLLEAEGEKTRYATDWSPDGRSVLFAQTERDSQTGWDLWVLTVAERRAAPLLATRAQEQAGVFSPDGRSIAYSSNASGRGEVYVEPFPGPGDAVRISADGGAFPRWRRDGAEIVYVTPGGTLMSAAVSGSNFEPPRKLFAQRMAFAQFYDVSADGELFVISLPPAPSNQPR